jgi:hypothetical protein
LPSVFPYPALFSRIWALLVEVFWSECWELLLTVTPRPVFDLPLPPRLPQSFARIKKWLEHAGSSPSLTILAGGKCDDSVGYFVEPCIVESKDPQDPIMKEVTGRAAWAGAQHTQGSCMRFLPESSISQMRGP